MLEGGWQTSDMPSILHTVIGKIVLVDSTGMKSVWTLTGTVVTIAI